MSITRTHLKIGLFGRLRIKWEKKSNKNSFSLAKRSITTQMANTFRIQIIIIKFILFKQTHLFTSKYVLRRF